MLWAHSNSLTAQHIYAATADLLLLPRRLDSCQAVQVRHAGHQAAHVLGENYVIPEVDLVVLSLTTFFLEEPFLITIMQMNLVGL